MARVIGLDIVGGYLLAAELDGNGTGTRVLTTLEAPLPMELTPTNAAGLGQWLRAQLAARNFTSKDAVCLVGRSQLTLKSQRVPPCPDGELPALIAFAVETDWHLPAATSVIDFQPGATVNGERENFVVAAPQTLVQTIEVMLREAGLNCRRLAPRPYGNRCARPETPMGGGQDGSGLLLATVGADTLELSLWSGEQMRVSRLSPLGDVDHATSRIVAEVRRTLVAHHAQDATSEVRQIGVSGAIPPGLVEALELATNQNVEIWQPFATGAVESARLHAAMGAAQRELTHAPWPIDLLHPKKPVVTRDNSRTTKILLGLGILFIPILAYGNMQWKLRDREARLDFQKKTLANLEKDLKDLQPVVQRHKAVAEWAHGEVNWFHELVDLTGTMGDTSKVYLTEFDGTVGQGNKRPNIKLTGRARDEAAVILSQTQWGLDVTEHYKVTPRGLTPSTQSGDFTWQFAVDLGLVKLPEDRYRERAVAHLAKHQASVPENKIRMTVAMADLPGSSGGRAMGSRPGMGSGMSRPTGPSPGASPSVNTGTSSPSAGSSSASSSTSGGNEDPLVAKIKHLKTLSYEAREAEINKAPRFLQARLRAMLKGEDK